MENTHLPIFTTPLTEDKITPEIAANYIRKHSDELEYLEKLESYYRGAHGILKRVKDNGLSNNRLVTNHAKYIADFTSGYLVGKPVVYTSEETDITPINEVLKNAEAYIQDTDLALDAAIFGRAYELIYTNELAEIKLARISPLEAFVVYSDTVDHKPIFGVYYFRVHDINGSFTGYKGYIVTDTYLQQITLTTSKTIISAGEPEPHYFGKVPLDEIYNNGQRIGDFEDVLTLIDAYNELQSDRVNDKEQFVNALLVIQGQVLGDTEDEAADTYSNIKSQGVMTLDDTGKAYYLTRQFDESGAEKLKESIQHDIHKISGVPDMSDQNFAGNVSGVAMKFKLLALEQMTAIKQGYFKEGLKYRLECISNILSISGHEKISIPDIKIEFTRSLPANLLEDAQTVTMLQGIVSQKTLLANAPFVTDVDEEVAAIEKEKQDALDRQSKMQEIMMRNATLGNSNMR